MHGAAHPAALLVMVGEIVEVALDRLRVRLVVAADVVEQPAGKHRAQFVENVVAGIEAHAVLLHALAEDLVHAPVRGAECPACSINASSNAKCDSV